MIVFRVDQRCTDILQDSVAVFIESPSLLQHKKFSKLSRVFHLTFVAIKLHEKYNRYRKITGERSLHHTGGRSRDERNRSVRKNTVVGHWRFN